MQILITGHQLDVTDALKQYVEKKLSRFSKLFDSSLRADVVLGKEAHHFVAKVALHVPGKPMHAETKSIDDMYRAIDQLIDKLNQQATKYKDQLANHRTH